MPYSIMIMQIELLSELHSILTAREKADEIRMKADEEFQIEKGRILNPERLKLNQEFDRKFKDLEIKQKMFVLIHTIPIIVH